MSRQNPRTRLGPYLLGERLGVGGMAEVYVAWRPTPRGSQRFALKRILPQLARDPRFVAMFCDEAHICSMLAHPNIVRVVDFGEDGGELFIAMEYVDGVSAARLLRACAARKINVPLPFVLYVATEVLRALGYAHEAVGEGGRRLNIVHRDVSPGNVLLGSHGQVKLTDFGIMRSAFVDRRTYPGELKGKLGYMSPEQAMGEDPDPRSDLFTLGIVVAELALLRPLFSGKNEVEVLTRTHSADLSTLEEQGAHLPAAFRNVLRRALRAKPTERYRTARAFRTGIDQLVQAGQRRWGAPEAGRWLKDQGLVPGPARARSGTRPVALDRPGSAARSGARVLDGLEGSLDADDDAATLRRR